MQEWCHVIIVLMSAGWQQSRARNRECCTLRWQPSSVLATHLWSPKPDKRLFKLACLSLFSSSLLATCFHRGTTCFEAGVLRLHLSVVLVTLPQARHSDDIAAIGPFDTWWVMMYKYYAIITFLLNSARTSLCINIYTCNLHCIMNWPCMQLLFMHSLRKFIMPFVSFMDCNI